ncbi:TonB-dependent receptor [Myroides albus]|uniref:TonB-dependent receptor n=1 Tax=Myroides albus TaxID=2562892 RepID=A0A6I3LH59_9FLAO|nr:outer membrane beta-barrel family protein [Myroides albus]MTG96906.1 TonB-dependent receptor [Myroides albus]UVD78344.1 TonB-dependent receptor [Myroides albus]
MKSTLLLATALFFTANINAQNSIKGNLQTKSNKAIDFAEIYLLDSNGALINQTYTTENGLFSIEDVKDRTYTIQIYSNGLKQYENTLEVDHSIDLGTIVIENDTQLEEIVIKSPTRIYEKKLDRTVFNIENSVHATNNDAVDLLKITPGLKVDTQSISLIGKSSVRVMINDKLVQLTGEELMQYLKSIPSDNIKKIEVITTPPAKYDAEGNSGLINIVLKENQPNAWNNQISTGVFTGHKATYRFSDVFSYNQGKISFKANISGSKGMSQVIENSTVFYANETWNGKSRRFNNNDRLSGNFQFDYQISEKTSIGVQYMGSIGNPKFDDNGQIIVDNHVHNYIQNIYTNAKNTGDINNQSANLHLIHNIDTVGTKLTMDVDYFNYNNYKNRVFNTKTQGVNNSPDNMFIASTSGDQIIDNFSAKIDMEQPLKWFKLSYGVKASFVTTRNKSDFFDLSSGIAIEDHNQKDNFKYQENTQAAYFSASKEFNDKLSMQVGMRVENTQTTGTSKVYNTENKKDYTKLFPTLYLTYNLNDNNSFSINYNRRIYRPAFWELNPFKWYITQYSVAGGNPKITPAFTDNIELSHIYKGKLTTSISYSKTKDRFSQYPMVEESTNMQIYIRENIIDSEGFNANINYSFNTIPWLQSQIGGYFFYSTSKLLKDVNLDVRDGGGMYFTANNTVYLNSDKTLNAQVDYWYQPKIRENMWAINPSHALSLGLKYAMMNKKLNLSIYANDIFNTSTQKVSTKTNGINQSYKNNYDNRYVNIGISYSFGNSKIKVTDHQGGNTDEKSRK